MHAGEAHNRSPGKQNKVTVEEQAARSIVSGDEGTCHEDAVRAFEIEKGLSVWAALKLYPHAVGWSVFFSIGVIMLAFDPQLLGSLYAMPAFQRQFGEEFEGSVSLPPRRPDNTPSYARSCLSRQLTPRQYIIPARWQSALSLGNPVGQCVGALLAGYPMDSFGRKRTFIACVALTAGLIFIQFFARTAPVLLVGELLCGLVLGAYVVIAPAYASEVCPLALRGVLTSYTNLCFVMGQLLANGVTAGTQGLRSHWAYSIPFALQWFWILLILPAMPFAPESPWWYVRQADLVSAEASLRRLVSPKTDVQRTLAAIVETDRTESMQAADSTYADCFARRKGGNLRRTEIGVGVYAIQVLSGIYLINFGTLFFNLAGLNTDQAFDMGIGFLAVGFVATCLSWIALTWAGRRTIYLHGLAWMTVLQLLVGILDCVPGSATKTGIAWAQCALMLMWNFVYDFSVGPMCFVILCEVSATKVRAKTIAVATAVQAVLGIVMTVAIPYLINPDAADLRGKLGFFFGGLAAACWTWAWLRVPETSGRTFKELDEMFERGVAARDFRTYAM